MMPKLWLIGFVILGSTITAFAQTPPNTPLPETPPRTVEPEAASPDETETGNPATVETPAPGIEVPRESESVNPAPLSLRYNAPSAPPRPEGGSVQPWANNFFENDFRYKNQPNAPYFPGEELKDMPLFELMGDPWTLSFGGELRNRYHDERNRLVPGGPGLNSYNQWRWRNYLDVKAGDRFRVYAEMLDASTFGEELPLTPIDVNRWDLQNLFADVNLMDIGGEALWLRYGRQELQYGSQRLVSPLDFATTRRNFEGFKAFWSNADWSLDAFATRPVNAASGNGPLSRFDNEADHADYSRTFSGVYATYKGLTANTFDLYWLWLREQDDLARGVRFADGSRQTVGLRWAGSQAAWSWDMEGAYQFGHDAGPSGPSETVSAGFGAGNLGYTFSEMPWTPKLMGVYHWGSGDKDPTDGRNNTFSTLFPLGHAYWGVIDNLGGQNLQDLSAQVLLKPAKKVSLLAAYHWFDLATDNDVLYNVAQAPLGRPFTGTEVGEELDLILNYAYSPNLAFQLQYAEFYYGEFVDNNLPRNDARQFFIQTAIRY